MCYHATRRTGTNYSPRSLVIMKKNNFSSAGSEAQYGPRTIEEIVKVFLAHSHSRFVAPYRRQKAKQATKENQDWYPDTRLGVDLKTLLHSDKSMEAGKEYQGVLRCDSENIVDEFLCRDAHFTFTETLPWHMKRNPIVFRGKYISVSRRDDGSLRLNFKQMPKIEAGFILDHYAFEVYRELRQALEGLIEK